ncbi:MAG TPA: sulfatase-like hydrolase/transferase [Thermoleophilaceae bacterium]|nr:sulfatase-like hydrolase/transferase [Thermoleophilaceae bacterium]
MRTVMNRIVMPLALAAALLLALLTSALGEATQAPATATRAAAKAKAPKPKPPRKPHVVLLIMDELPSDSLLDRRGRIDRVRYPNFAALAADSTWFRNAYSIFDSTSKAVPLILDGNWPRWGVTPDRAGHPRSIFDMFRRRGYRMVASEEASALCPPRMCRGGRARVPDIPPLLNRGRPQRFNRWVSTIRDGRPTLWMKHLLLPHVPYIYLPSGARTRPGARDPLPGMTTVPGFHDEYLTRHNEQRYLLQLGYTDRLLGRLLRQLKREGIYDETLVVVVADHGYLWRSGVQTRRRALAGTAHELSPVPLLVKRPVQRRGRVSDAFARTLDVPSTIADVLGLRLGYRDDGRSAFSRAARRIRRVTFPTREFNAVVSIPGRRWIAQRRRVVRRRLRQFGAGDLDRLYTGIGPNRKLIGQSVVGVARAGSLTGRLVDGHRYSNVRRGSGLVPAHITGRLGDGSGRLRDLAVAVNGRIAAVGRSFRLTGRSGEHFAFMVPEETLGEGHNSVEVFEVVGRGSLRLVARG